MANTNILFLTCSTKSRSGGIKQLYHNVVGLAAAGWHVSLAAPKGAGIVEHVKTHVSDVLELPTGRWAAASLVKSFCRARSIGTLHTFHNQSNKIGVLAKLLGARFKLFVNRGVSFMPHNIFYYHFPGISGFVSNAQATSLCLRRFGIPRRKLNVIYNAHMAADDFFTQTTPQNLKPGPKLCTVGSASRWKGLDVVIRAFNAMAGPLPLLYVIGVTDFGPFMDMVASDRRERVISLGRREDVPSLLSCMDVFTIAPRVGESCPNVVIEAFAAGLPVVATRVGGIPELVPEGRGGFLVDKEDHLALAGRWQQTLADPALRLTMGGYNRERIRFFSLERKVRNLLRVYAGETVVEDISDPLEQGTA